MIFSLIVRNNQLIAGNKTYRCAIGRSGISHEKVEGDGCTPMGAFLLHECWVRTDRVVLPEIAYNPHTITPTDGWCDDPASPHYNQHVHLPFAASHESLWLESPVYDIVFPLGYNDDPIVPGKGSAIFLHLATDDYQPTEGCIAIARNDMMELLPLLSADCLLTVE